MAEVNVLQAAVVPAPAKRVRFEERLRRAGLGRSRGATEVLQVNLGKRCNQACHHCHVDAGPKRTEMMNGETAHRVLDLLARSHSVHTLDVTGGAPELNPHFRYLVQGARALGKKVIDRCNLTVLLESGQTDTAQFLAAQGVEIVASLPCYLKENVERQRGLGVFEKSIEALRRLNALGYGCEGGGLVLTLVYNPVGAALPPAQGPLEATYKYELRKRFGIEFNRLFTITNMPISRFLHQLEREGRYQDYMELLVGAFNPEAARRVMCRYLISVGWDGRLYDCDFNQMLELPLGRRFRTLWDGDTLENLGSQTIAFGAHCYGCTAGAGSSCGGSLLGSSQ
ncbi:MAG: arsenosugar biosynthesis radical SAM (seleno)protein ArsS [Gammaproteobacteria bacterium]